MVLYLTVKGGSYAYNMQFEITYLPLDCLESTNKIGLLELLQYGQQWSCQEQEEANLHLRCESMSEEEEDAKILRSNDTLGHLLANSLKGGSRLLRYDLPCSSYKNYSRFIPIRCSEIMYNNLNRTSPGWAYLHP
ncbi:hypothetical protein V6N12_072166 [Hibiscus sabdariffa]|uniref:Uncharacterized protein n=1 Tax=Hibiscus sabdariffa TaxID=183260 RepID=A0ABR2FLY1_9ROSI